MIIFATEAPAEAGAREALLDRVMGPARVLKPSERLRAGRLPARGLALVARDDGKLVGSVRLWNVEAGGKPALLLGPLAVDPAAQGEGVGAGLMRLAIARAGDARPRGHHPGRRPGILRALRLHRRDDRRAYSCPRQSSAAGSSGWNSPRTGLVRRERTGRPGDGPEITVRGSNSPPKRPSLASFGDDPVHQAILVALRRAGSLEARLRVLHRLLEDLVEVLRGLELAGDLLDLRIVEDAPTTICRP